MSTRWAKCFVPDSVGRQANSRAALPSFFRSSVCLHSNTPCCPASPTFGALTRPGRTFLHPFRNHAAASAVRALGSRSSNSPSSFKAKPATARALLFSCPSLRVCSDAPDHFFAQPVQVFLFFPTSSLRCPSSYRTKGRFSKKPPDNSEKREAIGENTGAFSRLLRSFPILPTQTLSASPGVYRITRCKETSSPDFMHKLRCFLPFSVRRQNMGGRIPFTFLHSFSSIPQQSIFHALLITTISKFKIKNTHM